jgi:DNA-binding LacI/PurR family transcriptional regulator
MAMGAMRAAQARGLSIGEELSILGFDDIVLAEHANPPLTTMCQPIYEIGRRVCRMLVRILLGESLETDEFQVLFEPQLVMRDSTGPPLG